MFELMYPGADAIARVASVTSVKSVYAIGQTSFPDQELNI